MVFNTLGGKHTLNSFKVLKDEGRVVSISGDLDSVTTKQLGLNKVVRLLLSLKAKKVTKAAQKWVLCIGFY